MMSIRREIVAVVRSDAVAAESAPQPRNGVPVELDPRTDNQHTVGHAAAVTQQHLVFVGREPAGRRLDPRRAARDQPCFGATGEFTLEDAGAHHRPAGLVVVHLARFDDRQAESGVALENARRDSDPRAAPAHDDEIVTAAVGALRGQCAGHFRQLFRTRARAAVGQDRRRQFFERPLHGEPVLIGDGAGHGRNVGKAKAGTPRRRADFVGGRLPLLLPVGPVADDRAETGGRDLRDLVRADLGGGAQAVSQLGELHDALLRNRLATPWHDAGKLLSGHARQHGKDERQDAEGRKR